MKKVFQYLIKLIAGLMLFFPSMNALAFAQQSSQEASSNNPKHLYKILSLPDWQKSQQMTSLKLPPEDAAFIHLSTKEQLERIIEKYWQDQPKFVLLKIDTSKVKGTLVFEANPGGINKYYHLYNGVIPLEAILEIEVVEN